MADDAADLRNFILQLGAFGDLVEADATRVFREASQLAAEAVIVGNQYGPGAPTDTGFLRSSFRVGVDAPTPGPVRAPKTPGREAGSGAAIPAPSLGLELARVDLGSTVYITTNVEYAGFLEFLPRARRFGRLAGGPTTFVRPVEMRWPRIVEDTMRRRGIGNP